MPKRAGFFVFGGWPLAFGRFQPRFSLRFLPHLFARFLLHLFAALLAASFRCASCRIFRCASCRVFSLCFLLHLFAALPASAFAVLPTASFRCASCRIFLLCFLPHFSRAFYCIFLLRFLSRFSLPGPRYFTTAFPASGAIRFFRSGHGFGRVDCKSRLSVLSGDGAAAGKRGIGPSPPAFSDGRSIPFRLSSEVGRRHAPRLSVRAVPSSQRGRVGERAAEPLGAPPEQHRGNGLCRVARMDSCDAAAEAAGRNAERRTADKPSDGRNDGV